MILVLGGSGFIGYNFVKRFSKREKVRVFGKCGNQIIQDENIEYVWGDFKSANFELLLEGVDSVFHFISSIVPFDGTNRIIEDIETNIVPTIRLLENMKENDIKKIFFISSGGTVYGECNMPAKENDKLLPECVYASQKVIIENYLHLYEKYNNMQCFILRIANPYGLEVKANQDQGIIPIFTRKILKGEPVEIWGRGTNRRDYIYIDEVIDAIEAVYEYTGIYRIFNIGTGKNYSIQEIIKLIEKKMEKRAEVNYKNYRKCDLKNSLLDVSLIYQECGWKSKLTIEQGINNYVDKILKQK